jgi:hypothetical protein
MAARPRCIEASRQHAEPLRLAIACLVAGSAGRQRSAHHQLGTVAIEARQLGTAAVEALRWHAEMLGLAIARLVDGSTRRRRSKLTSAAQR